MNEVLSQLSLRAFIKINNQFLGFHVAPETTMWHLEAEHCTHRGLYARCKGNDLEDLIKEALEKMIEVEEHYKGKVYAFQTLYPEKHIYDIHEMVREMMRQNE